MYPRIMLKKLLEAAHHFPVVAVTGPRQSGKSTLIRAAFPNKPYANLESARDFDFAHTDPIGFLAQFPGGAVLDEIQKVPKLLSDIQVLVDEQQRKGMFIVSGSENLTLSQSLSQSLAGRVLILKLLPLSMSETKAFPLKITSVDDAIYTGFYPRIYNDRLNPTDTYAAYTQTYLERDVRNLLQVRELAKFRRFIELCAGRTAQLLNKDSLAGDVGVSPSTVEQWLSILEATFVCFRLQPWHANISKRLVKSPKLYFYDTGLVSYLLGIDAPTQISTHPLRGSLFETLQIAELIKSLWYHNLHNRLYFYRDSAGNEVDLLIQSADSYVPIEIKSGQTFDSTFLKGIRAFQNLTIKPQRPLIVLGGNEAQQRTDFDIVGWEDLSSTALNRLQASN